MNCRSAKENAGIRAKNKVRRAKADLATRNNTYGPRGERLYKGTAKYGNRWCGQIRVPPFGERVRSESYTNEADAARAYDRLVIQHFTPPYYLNFPDEIKQ